jgi:putative ABC transport system permease protein
MKFRLLYIQQANIARKKELFRIPLVIKPATYGVSIVIALAATILSALVVRHRLDHLDLIEVLKTRE